MFIGIFSLMILYYKLIQNWIALNVIIYILCKLEVI